MRGGFLLERLQARPGGWSARLRVPPEAPLFDGHFPGRPLAPGIALLLLVADLAGELGGRETVPVRLRGVRFRAPAGPGALLAVTFEEGRFTIHREDGIAAEGAMELAPPAEELAPAPAEAWEGLPPPFLPHVPPARLVTGAGGGCVLACLPARSPLAQRGRAPSCVVLEAAAQGAQVTNRRGAGPPARGGLLVRVQEATFPAGTLPLETPFAVRVQEDGAAPPLHRFRAQAALGDGLAEMAFAVLAS